MPPRRKAKPSATEKKCGTGYNGRNPKTTSLARAWRNVTCFAVDETVARFATARGCSTKNLLLVNTFF
jgi:hypothetical protein